MTGEHIDVRMARVEESLNRLDEKISSNHREIMGKLDPIVGKVEQHHEDLAALKRNDWWLIFIVTSAITLGGAYLGAHSSHGAVSSGSSAAEAQ